MQIGFLDVLISVVAVIVLIIPGFLFKKLKVLPESADKVLSTVVLYGCQSLMIFTTPDEVVPAP